MDNFWFKQDEKALFADLEWDKPERRDLAGRICVMGGNLHNLSAPAKAYEHIRSIGPSAIKLVLPDKTKRLIAQTIPEAQFLPSTPSGEFSREGLSELLEQLAWADTLLLPGDVGRNSETTILLEEVIDAYHEHLVITKDALDTLTPNANLLINRSRTTLIASFAQLQKIVKNSDEVAALTFTIDLVKLVEFLHNFTATYPVNILTYHQNQLIVASGGNVSTTKAIGAEEPLSWRVAVAALSACHLTWYPAKPFAALTQAAYQLMK